MWRRKYIVTFLALPEKVRFEKENVLEFGRKESLSGVLQLSDLGSAAKPYRALFFCKIS